MFICNFAAYLIAFLNTINKMAKISLMVSVLFFLTFPLRAQSDKQELNIKSYRNLLESKNTQQKIKSLLDLGEYHYSISNQRIHEKSIDSASYHAQKALDLSHSNNYKKGIGEAYILISKVYNRKDQSDNAIKFAKQAVDLFSKLDNKNDLALSYMTLVASKGKDNDLDESILLAGKAFLLYKQSGNKLEQAHALVEIAFLKMTLGNMQEGKVDLENSLKLYSEIGYEKTQRVYALLAVVYTQFGTYKEALENSLQAVKLVEKFNDTSLTSAEIYNYVAITYNQLRDIEKSNHYFQKAYKISNRFNDSMLDTMILTNIVQTFMHLKKNKEAVVYLKKMEKNIDKMDDFSRLMLISRAIRVYTDLKDFKTAEKYTSEAMIKVKEIESGNHNTVMLFPAIIRYLFESGQYDKARKYVADYKKLSEKKKDKKTLQEIHRMLFQLDSVQSKFVSAIKEYELQKAYKDSLFSQEKNKQIAELQIKFETEKKDKNLILKEQQNKLLRKQGELQESKLSKAVLLKNIGFGSMVLFLIIIILLFIGYRIKQKTNSILESQKDEINHKNAILQKLVVEKEWLLKEIHHRVKNNLQIVMSLLNTQSYHLKDTVAMDAIRESQNRIHSMSLIHKKLYQSESVTSINMAVYIQELVEFFKSTFDTGQRIQFIIDLEQIELDTSQAVPLGLIMNEAITNSIKHAFVNRENGSIFISFKNSEENQLVLCIKDDGVGLAGNFEEMEFQSLGMKLIKGFCQDLGAKLTVENNNGLFINIEFLHNQK